MLHLQHVSKRLGDFQLKNINLTINDNEYFVILGPTGTGKTVILEIIAGMYQPDKGEIFFEGKGITKLYPEERKIGFVYQDYVLFPHLNVQKNIIFGLEVKKTARKIIEDKLEKIVSLLGIKHLLYRYPETLSGGEQQRVSLARALITSPDLLLLDEPLSALDPRTKDIFQQELKKIHEQLKTTTIHITHDFTEALSLADRIGVMHQGEIVQVGTPEEIFNKPQSKFVAHFVGMENIFQGEIKHLGGRKGIQLEHFFLPVLTEYEQNINVGIRPEEIVLTNNENLVYEGYCSVKGTIKKMIPKGGLVRIELNIGSPLVALVSKLSCEELGFSCGQEVWALFKDTAVHIFK